MKSSKRQNDTNSEDDGNNLDDDIRSTMKIHDEIFACDGCEVDVKSDNSMKIHQGFNHDLLKSNCNVTYI